MEDKNKLITLLSLKNGLILAAVWIVIYAVLYFINPVMIFTNFWISLVIWVVVIVLLVIIGKSIRTEIGGFWTFGQAFKSFLIIALILSFTSVLYNVVLIKVINPNYPAEAASAIQDSQKAMMEKFGASSDQIDEAIAKSGNMEEKLQANVKNMTTNFGYSIAVYGVLALILAAILKKNEPILFSTLQDDESVPLDV
ncbi:putative Tic20 family protein [Pedobacter sp. UYEF25]